MPSVTALTTAALEALLHSCFKTEKCARGRRGYYAELETWDYMKDSIANFATDTVNAEHSGELWVQINIDTFSVFTLYK